MIKMAHQNGDTGNGQSQGQSSYARGSLHFQEPEREPLLKKHTTHENDEQPVFSSHINAHSHLPVYTNIHRIRRDVISIVEDYMSLEQLRDLRINISVIRPLVDQLYEMDDISIGMLSSHLISSHLHLQPISRYHDTKFWK